MSLLTFIRSKKAEWVAFKSKLRQTQILYFYLAEIVEVLVFAVPAALLIRHFLVQLSVVPSPSMVPTLAVGDRLFVNRAIYRFYNPHRGDIVVFKSPFGDDRDFVKRCVGLPGDTLEVKDGDVYINGKLLIIPGVNIQYDRLSFQKIQIPKDAYFMMGDNRANSYDSRYWGFVERKDVLGKAFFTVWPFTHMRPLR